MSTLVDHYLLHLKSLLPAKQREDIAAELRSSILATVEERERERGRALTDGELNDVLRGFGHPMVVAGRYLPMQHLIGPDVFPLYWYVLQAVLIVVTVVGGFLAGIALLTAPNALQSALQVALSAWWFALQAAAFVTLGFALLDYGKARFSFLDEFDARKVTAGVWGVRAAPLSPIPRADTVFEIAWTALVLLWWIEWLAFPSAWLGVELRLSVFVEALFYPVVALCIAELVRLGVDLVRPYRTPPRVVLRLALNVAWLALIVLAFRTEGFIEIAQNVSAENPDAVLVMAQMSMKIALAVVGVITATLVATDLVRLVRR
jgi:hypothetical protein